MRPGTTVLTVIFSAARSRARYYVELFIA